MRVNGASRKVNVAAPRSEHGLQLHPGARHHDLERPIRWREALDQALHVGWRVADHARRILPRRPDVANRIGLKNLPLDQPPAELHERGAVAIERASSHVQPREMLGAVAVTTCCTSVTCATPKGRTS